MQSVALSALGLGPQGLRGWVAFRYLQSIFVYLKPTFLVILGGKIDLLHTSPLQLEMEVLPHML